MKVVRMEMMMTIHAILMMVATVRMIMMRRMMMMALMMVSISTTQPNSAHD